MKTSPGGTPRRTAAAAFCLLLPLWLGSCMPAPGESGNAGAAQPPVAAPAPEPAPAPSPATSPEAPAPGGSVQGSGAEPGAVSGIEPGSAALPPQTVAPLVPSAGTGQAGAGSSGAGSPGAPSPGSAEEPVSGPAPQGLPAAGTPASPQAGQAPATGTGGPAAGPAPGAGAPGSGGSGAGSGGQTGNAEGTAVYYVALDDGGSSGVRFGCNDSLVPVHHADPVIREPLHAAMSRLLSGGAPPAGLYNALSSSSLQYVSGYLDGATVVVNLTGAVQPGGTCDIPRIDAQLTHTAVTAVGAIRAEIYVDGVRLADVLSLR